MNKEIVQPLSEENDRLLNYSSAPLRLSDYLLASSHGLCERSFKPSAVIFDMDGLLFDTENLTIPLWYTAGKPFGYRIKPDIVLKTVGISSKRARAVFIEEFGSDFPFDAIREEFRRLVQDEFDKNGVPKKKGLDFLLNHLCAAKIPLAVATSTRKITAANMLKRAGIFEKFAVIVGGDEVANGKPAPDIYLMAAEKLGFPPASCVGFEDSSAGLTALHAAGIRSVFIKDVIQPPPEVLATVWRRYNDLAEAVELFKLIF